MIELDSHFVPRSRQRGLSMVELMVGIAIGLFVVAGTAMLVSSQLTENRRLLLETQLLQDLRSSADIVTRELRRAGYSAASESTVWVPGAVAQPNTLAPVSLVGTSEIGFKYARGPTQEGPYGFKLDPNGALKTNLGSGAGSNWQDLTDPRTLRITALTIAPVPDPPIEVVLPCPSACPGPGGPQDCWPRLVVRSFTVTITGQAVHDAAVQRTLRTTVRLRNDHVRFDPANPIQYCPA